MMKELKKSGHVDICHCTDTKLRKIHLYSTIEKIKVILNL